VPISILATSNAVVSPDAHNAPAKRIPELDGVRALHFGPWGQSSQVFHSPDSTRTVSTPMLWPLGSIPSEVRM
jgi:hypothetical protein